MVKIHLDTDLGGDLDDLCALTLVLRWPDVELTGITTVAENDGRRAGYTRYALALAGRAGVPVAAGADGSSGHYSATPGLPPEEAYWPEPVTPAPGPVAEALALLRRSIEAGARIVAIGPYTNLALLEESSPGLLARADLYLMGGCLRPSAAGFPRWDNADDYNIQADVASARTVLTRSRPTLVPVEMTAQTALRRAHLPALRSAGPLGRLLADQAEAFAAEYGYEELYGRACAGLPDDLINFQHDPLACAVALGWEGARVERLGVRVELRDGLLHEIEDPAAPAIFVVTSVDGPGFGDLWVEVVTA